MARRPDVFNKNGFQEALRQQGCVESFVSPNTSDFRLLVPLVLRNLGEEKIFEILDQARDELKLGCQEPVWQEVAKYIGGWAEEQIEEYKAQK